MQQSQLGKAKVGKIKGANKYLGQGRQEELKTSMWSSTLQSCPHRLGFHPIEAANDFVLPLLAQCHCRPSVSLCAQGGWHPLLLTLRVLQMGKGHVETQGDLISLRITGT